MKITRDQVAHVANLARLALPDDEIDALTGQIDQILEYVEQLNTLDTDHIVPTAHAVPMENAFREDEVRPSLGVTKALSNAPSCDETSFKVPKVIE